MAARIDQLLAGFADGDAISRDARLIQDALRAAGYASDIYVVPEGIAPRMRAACRPLGEYRGQPDDVLVYHYSIASAATAVYTASPARRVVRYHNITPAEFFSGYDDGMVRTLRRAREELAGVVAAADVVWADSRFNAAEIETLDRRVHAGPDLVSGRSLRPETSSGPTRGTGSQPSSMSDRVQVLPVLFAPNAADTSPDAAVAAKYGGSLQNILFVGRMVPNKRVEDLILAVAWYTRTVSPFARLILVGSDRSCPRYFALLRLLALGLDLPNVCFEGFASEAGLAACYRAASLFVSASDHEGYCLPLVEAMHCGVPVIAKDTGGMPEALGGAGVLYTDLDAPELAELMHRVLADAALRAQVLESQRRRMAVVQARDLREAVAELVRALVPAAG